jgi:tetratricopeptide (TPR) repeat protein
MIKVGIDMSENAKIPWWRNDASIFAVLLLIAIAGFAVTYAVTSSYRHREDALARRSFQAGVNSYNAGRKAAAVTDFRTALLYSHDNPEYRLRLAQALAANDQVDQAAAYYLNLLETQPGSGPYNLELARLRARQNQPEEASRYFHAAIYGIWQKDPDLHRFQARVELINYLVSRKALPEAQAEAIALATETPSTDTEARLQTADLLLKTGEFERALNSYVALIPDESKRASEGAGAAAFALGRYRSTAKFLRASRQLGPVDSETQKRLKQSTAVLDADPDQPHLSAKARAIRVADAYRIAGERVQNCAAEKNQPLTDSSATPTELKGLYDEWLRAVPEARLRTLTRDPEARDAVLELVYRIQEATARICGTGQEKDWALLMIARYGSGVQR